MKRQFALAISVVLTLAVTLSGTVIALASAQTQLISINRDGTASGNYGSGGTWFSANGRYVAFTSNAGDLVANDVPGTDVFVRDLQAGTTTLVSVNRFGTSGGNGQSLYPAVSADGRFVAFESYASDLVSNDTNYRFFTDIFVRDLQAGTTTLVSVNHAGTDSGNGSSSEAVISADGRFVAFYSNASDLVGNDTNGHTYDVFVRDLQVGTTSLVSVNTSGGSGNRDSASQLPVAISADGRLVAFSSPASNLVTNDTNGTLWDVFVRDLQAGTTTLVSVNLANGTGPHHSDYPLMSADGRYVVFSSSVNNLVSNDTNNTTDVFVRDLQAGTTTLVSVNRLGTASANSGSGAHMLTPDGRFVAFTSLATDLVDVSDTNGASDVFVRDLQTGTTTLASVNHLGTGTGNGLSYNNSLGISADGRFVTFDARATDLVSNDTNGNVDVFVRDLQASTTMLMSVNLAGTGTGNNASYQPAITADGKFVSFTSYATDLVSLPDANRNDYDVFIRALNQPPTADAGGLYSVNEGASVTVTASGNDSEGGPLTYAWDLNNDGTFETSGQSATFSAASLDGPTSRTIKVQVTDNGGLTATDQATVNVLNVAPGATFNEPGTVDEGSIINLSLTDPTDPSSADVEAGFTYAFDCGDGGGYGAFGSSASASCPTDDDGARAIGGKIRDKDGGETEYTATVTIDNVAPTATFDEPGAVNEGNAINLSLTGAIDPSSADVTAGFTYAFDCGDGNGYGSFSPAGSASCPTDDNGTRIVGGKIRDRDSGETEYTAAVTIDNVAPTASFANTSSTLIAGQSATLVFSNPSDPSAADTAAGFLYSYDCTNDGAFELAASSLTSYACSYPAAGAFTARGRIADKDGSYTDYTAAITVLTPQQAIEGLIEKVRDLVRRGVLNNGQGNALIAKLEAAIRSLDRGNVNTALNQLGAFVNQVNAFMNAGILPPSEGQLLLDCANQIIAALSG